MQVQLAEHQADWEGILALQQQNLKLESLSPEQKQDGFVTVLHTVSLLQEMAEHLGQVIAVDKGRVVGYALAMARAIEPKIPVLIPMFRMINQLSFEGQALQDANYYVMGQVCIEQAYRGQGIFGQLYAMHRQTFSQSFDYCLTEVSTSNGRSMRAHEKVGFQTIHSFTDPTDEWNILLWDFK